MSSGIHAALPSGDEAVEKSFQQSMAASSMWAKQNAKTNVFLTSIIVMKSMVGVGILGIVIWPSFLALRRAQFRSHPDLRPHPHSSWTGANHV